MDTRPIQEIFRSQFDIEIQQMSYYEEAFTHSSYANEHKTSTGPLPYNERIEFLGDAVLELSVSTYLYRQTPTLSEGDMSKLRAKIVCEASLAARCQECGFDRYVRLSKGEDLNGGRERPKLLCDLFEAVVGALYLDRGLEVVEQFLDQVLYPKIDDGTFAGTVDYKTKLQERLQRNGRVNLVYETVDTAVEDGKHRFTVEVRLDGEVIGQGVGPNKKVAEQMAAHVACNHKIPNKKH